MNELVLPNDTNTLGNLMGGRLLHLMDVCAAIAAQRHSNRTVVTASVDSVDFRSAIRLGEVVVMRATVNRAFRTSMEVGIDVWAEDNTAGTRRHCNHAYYTFVAVDDDAAPVAVRPLHPETEAEQERFEAAARRREVRLVLAGRMAPGDSTHLREMLGAVALEPPAREPEG